MVGGKTGEIGWPQVEVFGKKYLKERLVNFNKWLTKF